MSGDHYDYETAYAECFHLLTKARDHINTLETNLARAVEVKQDATPPVDWLGEALRMAAHGKPLPPQRLLEMFADRNNWIQVYDKQRCWWAWCGPTIPPYEQPAAALKIRE